MQCIHKCNVQARSCNHSCREKAVSITYCECVFVALVTVHAMRVRHIVISDCPALQYISTLSHKQHEFREKRY
jgi:hypothetical protein